MYYAGIGSRECPEEVEKIIDILGIYFAKKGYTLRSGGANGSDTFFERACNKVGAAKEIFVPWEGFNNSTSTLVVKEEAYPFVEKFHPKPYNLSKVAFLLMARNTHQILGYDLKTPSKFVICYTKDGKTIGGTAQGIRIATAYNIPVFNIGAYKSAGECEVAIKDFIIKNNL